MSLYHREHLKTILNPSYNYDENLCFFFSQHKGVLETFYDPKSTLGEVSSCFVGVSFEFCYNLTNNTL